MPVLPGKTAYIVTGNPDTLNVSPTDFTSLGHHPGELGLEFEANQRQYQIVQVDSGVTSATPTGVIAANQAAYWKDRSVYLVTNDSRMAVAGQTAQGFANELAGVFRNAVTVLPTVNGVGSVTAVLQKGRNIPVKEAGTPAVGDHLVVNTSTPRADFTSIAAGSAITNTKYGTYTSAISGGNANADLDIPSIP